MDINEGRIQFEDLPKVEQRIVEAYLPLIHELFAVTPPPAGVHNPAEFHGHGDLKRFLEMFVAIFRTTTLNAFNSNDGGKHNDAFLEQCMKKFRDVYRSNYRNVHYLSSNRIQKVRQLAEVAALDTIVTEDKAKSRLRKLISLEGKWIERINTCKRMKIIDSIQVDTINDFRFKIESEFSLLYGDSRTDFYDELWFKSRHGQMMGDIKKYFEAQIPYGEEDKRVIAETTSAFEKMVNEKVIDDLIKRNDRNKENVRSLMQLAVVCSVTNYKLQMAEFLESLSLGQHTVVKDFHVEVRKSCAPRFGIKTAKQNMTTRDLEADLTNQYEKQIHESLRQLIAERAEKAKQTLRELEDMGKSKLDNFIEDYQKGVNGYDVPQNHVTQLQNRMEILFVTALEELKEGSFADATSMDLLIQESTPKLLLTPSAEQCKRDKEIKEIVEKCQEEYKKQLDSFLRKDGKSGDAAKMHHEKIKAWCNAGIKTTLLEKFGADECWDAYISEFRAFADKHWNERKSQYHTYPNAFTPTSIPSHYIFSLNPEPASTNPFSQFAPSQNQTATTSSLPERSRPSTSTGLPQFPPVTPFALSKSQSRRSVTSTKLSPSQGQATIAFTQNPKSPPSVHILKRV